MADSQGRSVFSKHHSILGKLPCLIACKSVSIINIDNILMVLAVVMVGFICAVASTASYHG